jgi:hypothetical protein
VASEGGDGVASAVEVVVADAAGVAVREGANAVGDGVGVGLGDAGRIWIAGVVSLPLEPRHASRKAPPAAARSWRNSRRERAAVSPLAGPSAASPLGAVLTRAL